jgi:hypothetical protein
LRPVRFLFAASLAACVLSTAACASEVAGSGTGAGPRSGAVLPSSASASGLPSGSSAAGSSAAPSASAGSSARSSAGSSSAPGTHPVPSTPLRTVTAHAPNGTSYVVKIWAENEVTDCAAHAYGAPVISFLRQHPCFGMRQVLATTTVDGKPVGFAQRSIGFRGGMNRSYRAAGQFRELVSRSGTGNLNDLLREGYRLPSGPSAVPFPNAFSALGQDNSVTIVEAWYLNGPTTTRRWCTWRRTSSCRCSPAVAVIASSPPRS